MRIAMVHSDLPPDGGGGGGVRHQVHGLCEALTRRGHEVTAHILGPVPKGVGYEVRRLRAGPWSEGSHARRLAAAPLAFAAADYGDVDVIHAHGDSQLLVRRGTPIVRTFYGSARDEGRYSGSAKRQVVETYNFAGERLARRLATRTVGISCATATAIGPLDAIIPCGIDRERFRPETKAERPTVLFIGQMAGRKRGALVLRSFQEHVLQRVPDAELVLVAADAEPAPNVRAVTSATDDELAALLRSAWVFTMPSTYEGFGVPYVEAMASGTAVVTTPNAGALELFEASNSGGELVPDVKLGKTISALLEDTQRRERLEAAGRSASARYGWPVVEAEYEAAYAEAVA